MLVLESSSQRSAETARTLSVRQLVVRTTVYGEPMQPFFRHIAIEREYESGAPRSETHRIGVIGGVVPGVNADGGARGGTHLRHAVKWDGHALAFESGSYSGHTAEVGVWAERREVWALDPHGRLRVVVTTRSADNVSSNVTLLYRRRAIS